VHSRKTNIVWRKNPNHSPKFKVAELRKLAALAKIPNRQRLKKHELAEALDRYFAAARIWIAWKSRKQKAKEIKPIQIANNKNEHNQLIDPLTLDLLEEPIWVYHLDCGNQAHYSVKTLVEYLSISKTFIDPLTGIALKDSHLRELDELARKHGIVAPSLLLLSRSAIPEQNRTQQSLITGLERCAGEYVDKFRQMIESEPPYQDRQRTAEEFNLRVHKEFIDILKYLYSLDKETAIISLKQWIEFLEGPPINPTKDPANFKKPILDWLKSLCNETAWTHL